MSEILLCERVGVTLRLTLNRPDARNALDAEMQEALGDVVRTVCKDPSIAALVIAGAGGAFCGGGDVRGDMASRRPIFANRMRFKRIDQWVGRLIDMPKPVIAAVDGAAAGGGFALALCADYILATPRAFFTAGFGRIGLVPDMSMTYLLPRIVGLQRSKDILFSCRRIGSEEAKRIGIVHSIHESGALLAEAHALAAHLATTARTGIKGALGSISPQGAP